MAEPTRKYYRACGWSCWLGCWLILGTLAAKADAFDTLRIYWQNYLITNAGSASSVASTANSYWSSMNTGAGRTSLWNDLPLGSVSANLVSTYQRLQAMATAWAMPGNSLQNNASLAAAVADGLDWMNANAYTTATVEYNNWFHWEISGPQALNNTAVLLYPALSGTQITNYLAAVDRFSPGGTGATYGWMTGANTADKVLVVAIRGILGRNAGKLSSAQTNLSIVFPYVTSGDGFYPDGSFVFHGNIAYNGHYGLVLLGDIPKLVNLLQGSTWQITDPNLTNVYNWVSNSFIPFVYHGSMMDMVRGRAISWSYET
ncbi:MAG TPA: hyaluronate lyase, partial [Verrucomicrobiae bacterium]